MNVNVNGGDALRIYDAVSNAVNFEIASDGKTHIGTKKPIPFPNGPHGDAMLSVDGKILAKSIYVNIHNTVWPDYVFEKSYKLMPILELKSIIERDKHLPGVPCEKEISEKGLSISEMQVIQMQKIEELTLYIVELKLEIEKMKSELNKLK